MRIQRASNSAKIILPLEPMGRGGEAMIYPVPPEGNLVAKLYHRPTDAHNRKLRAMLANPPVDPAESKGHVSIAWPVDLLKTLDHSELVIGYLMHRVRDMRPVMDFYSPATRRKNCPLFHYQYLIRTARNLASTVKAVHSRGYVIGDVNESNVLVSQKTLVTLVDTDSFQVTDPQSGLIYRCTVGKPEYTPPELQGKIFKEMDRNAQHDLFGLGVLIFQLLMEGTHPFDGAYQGQGTPPLREERIFSGNFVYGHRRGPYNIKPLAPKFTMLDPGLQALFLLCFENGHNNPAARPDANSWQQALLTAENNLIICPKNEQHRYGSHLRECPWCERTLKLAGRDPFPAKQIVRDGTFIDIARKNEKTEKRKLPKRPPKHIPIIAIPIGPPLVVAPGKQGWFVFFSIMLNTLAPILGYELMHRAQATMMEFQQDNLSNSVLQSGAGWLTYGLTIGIIQAMSLRKHLPVFFSWILATGIGGMLGGLWAKSLEIPYQYNILFILFLIWISQTIVLNRTVSNSGRWLIGNTVAALAFHFLLQGLLVEPFILLYLILMGGLQGLVGALLLNGLKRK